VLVLQLAVVAIAQESLRNAGTGAESSASPLSQAATAESSQSDGRGERGSPAPSASRASGTANNSSEGAATQSGKAGGGGDPRFGGERHPLYRLTKSDTVDVNFTFSSEFNQTLTVGPDGFVALKGAGALLAEGKTIPELQTAIGNVYRSFLHDPEVTVTLKEFDKPYFLASGEVGKPGKYELRGDVTVSEAIAIAGGLTQQAKHSEVVVFRRVSADLAESHVVNVKKMLDGRDVHEDLHLQPGDFVFVPQSRISKIRKYIPSNSVGLYANPMQ
jgi:polysaccharide biosynthesis/export protein